MIFDDTDTQPQETAIEAAPQEQPEVVQQQEQAVQDQKALNFKALRESKERAERERDEAFRRLQEIERSQQDHVHEEDEEPNLNPDDLVEWKHVQKKMKKMENQLKNYQQQTAEQTIETKLKAQYADFDKVVSKENVEALRASYPEMFQTINTSQDLYSKAVTAYTMIKKLNIQQEDIYEADRALAQKNAAKPRPLASVSPQQGDSPLSKANAFANGLTDDLKKQLYKEMMELRKSN